jgi:hypothetical protein
MTQQSRDVGRFRLAKPLTYVRPRWPHCAYLIYGICRRPLYVAYAWWTSPALSVILG